MWINLGTLEKCPQNKLQYVQKSKSVTKSPTNENTLVEKDTQKESKIVGTETT